jgi:hypothetical protein
LNDISENYSQQHGQANSPRNDFRADQSRSIIEALRHLDDVLGAGLFIGLHPRLTQKLSAMLFQSVYGWFEYANKCLLTRYGSPRRFDDPDMSSARLFQALKVFRCSPCSVSEKSLSYE